MKWSVYKNTCLAQWQQQKFRRVERSEVLQCFYQRKSLILTFTKRSDTLPLMSTHSAPWTVPVRLWFFRVHIYCKSQWRSQRGWPCPPTGNLPAPLPPDLWQSCWLHIVSLITFFLLSNTWSWAGTQSGLQWFRRINLMFLLRCTSGHHCQNLQGKKWCRVNPIALPHKYTICILFNAMLETVAATETINNDCLSC